MKNNHTVSYRNGSVAYIRTTEEPVFVLDIADKGEEHPGEVTVRRPTRGDRGVIHLVEHFFCDELCSYDDIVKASANRHLAEFREEKRVHDTVSAKSEPVYSPAPKGPLPN